MKTYIRICLFLILQYSINSLSGQVILKEGTSTAATHEGDDFHISRTLTLTWTATPPDSFFQAMANQNFTDATGWDFQFMPDAGERLGDSFDIRHYEPWVNDPPKYVGRYPDSGEIGGAVLAAMYTPQRPDDPDPSKIRWIQVVSASPHEPLGKPPYDPFVDNKLRLDGPDNTTDPYYHGGDSTKPRLFYDVPDRHELEGDPESDPAAIWHGQAYLVEDLGPGAAGDGTPVDHRVEVFGALDWGFVYTAVDTPEPSIFCEAGVFTIALAVVARRVRQKRRSAWFVPPQYQHGPI